MKTLLDIYNEGVVGDIVSEDNIIDGEILIKENPYGFWIIIGIIIFTILLIFISVKLFKFFNKDDE